MSNFNPQDIIDSRASGGRGDYSEIASTSQLIKVVFDDASRSASIGPNHVEDEAMDCIAMKLARIIHRTSEHDIDSWQDIAGYATLVVNYIKQQEAKTNR